MRKLQKMGIQVWPSPDVMEFMGAKDALTKIANLNIGLEDTLSYYTEDAFIAGFKKTMAFQPRVIKQNRGSAGEGIWIIKLKAGNYCSTYGQRMCGDNEVLSLMEANDNSERCDNIEGMFFNGIGSYTYVRLFMSISQIYRHSIYIYDIIYDYSIVGSLVKLLRC